MKKFLSLVLALVMAMSLVTVSAGAKDFTDNDTITYDEAVAVISTAGIVDGYTDGSFNPTGNLTRGAASKIICNLILGPTTAAALSADTAPYSDVPISNEFSGYIAYCQAEGIISGYADGTFRPASPLTGYAFMKMLLGALDYDSSIEGYTGANWSVNVAKRALGIDMDDGYVGTYVGTKALTREEACLFAFNTLTANMVNYPDNSSITVGDITITNSSKAEDVEIIGGNDGNVYDADNILQFAEKYFPNLKVIETTDDFGRVADKWTYKNIEIGTYATAADYTYTAAASGDTNVDKVKDMGLRDYVVKNAGASNDTVLTVNGQDMSNTLTTGKTTLEANAAVLAGYVKNGTTVQVYLSDDTADLISHIAVIQTQVMQINRVTSGDVTLNRVENSGHVVAAVEDDDDCYDDLKDLKSDDFVVITPLTTDEGATYEVNEVFVPTTASGTISSVKVDKTNLATGITMDGTAYSMSYNWTVEDAGTVANRVYVLNGSSVSSKVTSTAYLDAFGYVIYVENVNATTDHILFDETYTNVVGGRIHYFAQGWDMKGNEVTLDLGSNAANVVDGTNQALDPGTVYAYTSDTNNSNADYEIGRAVTSGTVTGEKWLASKTSIDGIYFADDVKYIFITWDGGDVDTITVKEGAQEVSVGVDYQYVKNSDNSKITAVILSSDIDVEVSQNVMYIQKETNTYLDADGKTCSIVTAYIDGSKVPNVYLNKRLGSVGHSTVDAFYTYSVDETVTPNIYTVNLYHNASGKATSVISSATFDAADIKNNAYIDAGDITAAPAFAGHDLNLANTTVIDLRDGGTLASASDMADLPDGTVLTVSFVYNDSTSSTSMGRVSYLFVLDTDSTATVPAPTITTNPADGTYYDGDTVTLTVAATVTGTPSYQWYTVGDEEDAEIEGATSPTYTFTAENETEEDIVTTYYCKVTNTVDGATNEVDSDEATITIAAGSAPAVTAVTAVGGEEKITATVTLTGDIAAGDTVTILVERYSDGIWGQVGIETKSSALAASATSADVDVAVPDSDAANYRVTATLKDSEGTTLATKTSSILNLTVSAAEAPEDEA